MNERRPPDPIPVLLLALLPLWICLSPNIIQSSSLRRCSTLPVWLSVCLVYLSLWCFIYVYQYMFTSVFRSVFVRFSLSSCLSMPKGLKRNGKWSCLHHRQSLGSICSNHQILCIHSSICPFFHQLVCRFIHLAVHVFIWTACYSFIHIFIHAFFISFVPQAIHPSIRYIPFFIFNCPPKPQQQTKRLPL